VHRPLRRTTSAVLVVACVLGLAGADRPGGSIDPYSSYQRADPNGCAIAQQQPGVLQFRDMLTARLGGWGDNIVACSDYEHEEGRAWDWMRDAHDPAEAATVVTMLDWLLATDRYGNRHAMARRLGLAYVIWNGGFLNLSAGTSHGWEDLSACTPATTDPSVCHTNHVHFSFAWSGATARTSWYTVTDRPADWYPPPVAR
jgi:hypothetical protein